MKNNTKALSMETSDAKRSAFQSLKKTQVDIIDSQLPTTANL